MSEKEPFPVASTVITPDQSSMTPQPTTVPSGSPSSAPQEIKALAGSTPGVPLSQLPQVVEAQQREAALPALQVSGTVKQPSRLLELVIVFVQLFAILMLLGGVFPPILWQITFLQVLGVLFVGGALFVAAWALLSFKQKIRLLPSPNPRGFLVTGGPFAYIRHPLYFALLLGGLGLVLAYPTIARLIAWAVLCVVLTIKIRYEETLLAQRYSGYDKYLAHTGRLFPRLAFKKAEPLTLPPNAGTTDTKE